MSFNIDANIYNKVLSSQLEDIQELKRSVLSRGEYKLVSKLESLLKSKMREDNFLKIDTDAFAKRVVEKKAYEKIKGQIRFNQNNLLSDRNHLPEKLKEIDQKYNGLCELICNKVLIDELLGKGDEDDIEFLDQNINIAGLNIDSINKSHLLEVYSLFEKIIAFLFGIYPDNIFSIRDQWNLLVERSGEKRINEDLLFRELNKIEDGKVLKMEIFEKNFTSFRGHSMLIKKISDNEFIFFDPDHGEFRGLYQRALTDLINGRIQERQGADVFFCKGESYIRKLQDKKILEIARVNISR